MFEERQRPACRLLADTFTEVRNVGGHLISAHIREKGPRFRSWTLAAVATALMLTDKADGVLARMSNIPSVEYTARDERVDKEFYERIMDAISEVSGDTQYVIYNRATNIRNSRVERERQKLRDNGLPAGSRTLGKLKTLTQNIGFIADLSPAGELFPDAVHAIHVGAVALSIISGAEIIIDADTQLALNQLGYPD